MQLRRLGRSDLRVPPLAFGCNVIGWTADEATSFRLLDRLLDTGLTFLDTADVYTRWAPGHVGGESESIIGRWMKARGCRDRIILATKVGMEMGSAEAKADSAAIVNAADAKAGLAPAYIAKAVEASLRRLQTDYIDLYQSHLDDADTPQAETLGAYQRLIEAGKVRVIGASNFSPARLEEALKLSAAQGLPRYESVQPEYNLVVRDVFEGPLERVCVENEVGVITFFSLAAGFLTGKYRSEADLAKSVRGGRSVAKNLNPRGLRILAGLDRVAQETGTEPATVALAWLMAKPAVTAPIASATSLAQIDGLLAATRLSLTAEQVRLLDEASAPAAA